MCNCNATCCGNWISCIVASDLDALAQIEPDDALTAAAARMLLIHRWRRIVLRFPELPAELMPDNAPLTRPRNAVANAYRRFWAASERWLDSEIGGQSGMPAANGLQQNRFGMGLRG